MDALKIPFACGCNPIKEDLSFLYVRFGINFGAVVLDSSQSRSVKKKQILDDSKNDGSIQSNMASTGLSESVSPQSRSRIDSRGYA